MPRALIRAVRACAALAALVTCVGPAFSETVPRVPPLVHRFIVQNCVAMYGGLEQAVDCLAGEVDGYRATVEILLDDDDPDDAAARYRSCAGLDRSLFHHRFHRHRAACMSEPLS